jgi:hypothetical protein
MLGGHALLVGGASLRRDDVGLVSIYQEGVLVDAATTQLGAEASLAPGEQFDRSLRRVWIDKSKVELILRMNTNADGDHHDDDQSDTVTTAQAFARSVFDPRRLREWKRLVEERLWKSISFCHRRVATTDMGLINFPMEMLDHINIAEHAFDRDHEQRRPRNEAPPISKDEELTMWRGLMEPCRSHTQRLELRGELTEVQARVVSTVYGKHASAAVSSASACRTTSLSVCRLRVLCLTDIYLTQQVANILGEIIKGNASPSCLKELSLSKCTCEQDAWSALLANAPSYDSSMTYKEKHSKASGKESYTMRTSSLFRSSSPLMPSTLHALYLGDCNLRQADVEEILSSLWGYPLLKTLYMNGQQSFDASQVDSLLIAHLEENANIEHIQLPSMNQHDSQIQLYTELNRCGRRLLQARRDAGNGLGLTAPMGLWPLVLERIRRIPGLTPTRRANARYYFVKALHGISTSGGSGGTRLP